MNLEPPPIDARSFDDLMREAEARLRARCPDWTDFNAGDPGRTLVELFAYMTETLIYRANRLPQRAYHEFFRMIGIAVQPPAAATVDLQVRRDETEGEVTIPPGAGVLAELGGRSVRFETLRPLVLKAGEGEGHVAAAHCERIEGEVLGQSDGTPGQAFSLARAPLIAPVDGIANPEIGVAATQAGAGQRDWRGTRFDLWTCVERFEGTDPEARQARVDLFTGLVQFAPAIRLVHDEGGLGSATVPARVPEAGREIRAWYRVGGGEEGNLPAGALSRLETPIKGVSVTNPGPATGGRTAETVENALARAPLVLAARDRAVTAQDYGTLAAALPDVARATAFAPAERWRHAQGGSVAVVVVPHLSQDERAKPPTRARLSGAESDRALEAVSDHLEARRPLGAVIVPRWARYKPVRVHLRAAADPLADPRDVRARIETALDRLISPLPVGEAPGWRFGSPLRSWHIGEVLRKEAAIAYSEDPVLEAVESPVGICADLACDPHQPGVWYAADGDVLYRSVNDGAGWEAMHRFGGESVERIVTADPADDAAAMTGLVVAVTGRRGEAGERLGGALWVSRDCGGSWEVLLRFQKVSHVHDVACLARDGWAVLLLATADGLREITLGGERNWRRLTLGPGSGDTPVWAVTTARNPAGSAARYSVMAALDGAGLFLSARDGLSGTFRAIGPGGHEGRLFRVLETQTYAGHARIWAGIRTPGNGNENPGCFEYRITGKDEDPPVTPHFTGWNGESCRGLAFMDDLVLAATHESGVHAMRLSDAAPMWTPADVRCGLPRRNMDQLQPIGAIAARSGLAMAAPDRRDDGEGGGVYASDDGTRFVSRGHALHRGRITLPPGWLFCAAEEGHRIEIQPAAPEQSEEEGG